MAEAPCSSSSDAAASVSVPNAESSSSSPKRDQVKEMAANLLVQGRRHLLVSDIPSAVLTLAEASRVLGEEFGETAPECAEAYYYYGISLLEMARTDSDVLGGAVEGGGEKEDGDGSDESSGEGSEEEDEDEEKDEMECEGEDKGETVDGEPKEAKESDKSEEGGEVQDKAAGDAAPASDEMNLTKASEAGKEGASLSKGETSVNGTSAKGKSLKSAETDGKDPASTASGADSKGKSLKPADSSEVKVDDEDAEDIPNLQLAWEILELAKQIYTRQAEEDAAIKPRLADTLLRLAEVAIESENYSSAVDDLNACLDIQTACLPADSRSLAETQYQLGVACTFMSEFKKAVTCFETAAAIIQKRIENLGDPAHRKASIEEPRNAFYTVEGEIEELTSLLPDIRDKIADTMDMEAEAARKITEMAAQVKAQDGESGFASTSNGSQKDSGSSSSVTNGDSKPVGDISHLIRKKRKPDEQCESPAKKACVDS